VAEVDSKRGDWAALVSAMEGEAQRECPRCAGHKTQTFGWAECSVTVNCARCDGTGRIDTHLGLRIALRLARACLRVWERRNCDPDIRGSCPGTEIPCRNCSGPRLALDAAEAWLEEPTEERREVCRGIASNWGSEDGPWVADAWLAAPVLIAAGFEGPGWEPGLLAEAMGSAARLLGVEAVAGLVSEVRSEEV